jgi:hypothetical protein
MGKGGNDLIYKIYKSTEREMDPLLTQTSALIFSMFPGRQLMKGSLQNKKDNLKKCQKIS